MRSRCFQRIQASLCIFYEIGFVCARFDPPDDAALYGNGAVADKRPQKNFGSSKRLADQ